MTLQAILPSVLSIIGTAITIASFYRANKKDYHFEQERRVTEAEERARQHTTTSMKLDQILNNHSRLEKDISSLNGRLGVVEDKVIKHESDREYTKLLFSRLEELLTTRGKI